MNKLAALPLAVLLTFPLACKKEEQRPEPGADAEPAKATKPDQPPAAAIAHGGVGSPPSKSDGCRKAVDAALAKLEATGDPLEAAIAGVIVLEDDPRFNAGTGSRVRIDGETVQMDASVMTSAGRFGAIAGVERIKNPVLAARAILDTPHLLVAGDGATRFAHTFLDEYDPATPEMRKKTADIIKKLRKQDPSLPKRWSEFDWRSRWNFERTLKEAGLGVDQIGRDTVGVAVRGADGTFAVALSTGGTPITLRGRVGDVPILGAGLFSGEHGAVAATGSGERIMEAGLSREVYRAIAGGTDVTEATRAGVETIGDRGSIGLIAISRDRMDAAADRPMAWAARELGSKTWHGPDPAKTPE